MQNRILSQLLIIVAVVLPSLTFGQTNTVNTFSPYSLYGLGELQSPGTIQTRSMGGAGVAARSFSSINLLNPASYSIALRKGILFDYGIEGANYISSQKIAGEMERGSYQTGNFRDIALQIPIARGFGFGFSLTPYSSVGYYFEDSGINSAGNYYSSVNQGSGDITEVKLGIGLQLSKSLSVGFAAQYYWGDIDREFNTSITNLTSASYAVSSVAVDQLSVTRVRGQAGVQWSPIVTRRRALTVGATYDLGGNLNPRSSRLTTSYSSDGYSSEYAQSDTTHIELIMPQKLSVGVAYNTESLSLLADFTYQNWLNNNKDIVEYSVSGIDVRYANFSELKLGVEYTPHRTDIRKYLNRIGYRAGLRLGGYQYTVGGERLSQYAVTTGMGFPIKMIGISRVDLGLEWSSMGSHKTITTTSGEAYGLIRQSSIKLSLGVTMFGDDYWFQRPQID